MPVRIADVIVPEVFNNYMVKNTMEINAFYQTGVMRSDSDLAGKLAGGGRTFNVPFWKDLDDTESDPASDDPDSHAIPGAITTGRDVAIRQIRTRGWSTMNLTQELAGADPMKAIGNRVNAYWGRQFDAISMSTIRGVIADNIANDNGDMVEDISIDTPAALTAANLFSAEAVSATLQTMGDAKRELKLVVMHSVVHTRLADLDLIEFRPDSEGKIWHDYYQGLRVQVSDNAPVVQGANKTMYHTYFFGPAALGWAEASVDKPVEVDPVPSAGDGMGMETLWTRRQFAIHPYGIKFTDTSVGGEFPTNTELALAANWDRVYPERKQIPIAALITNG
jgi:hypothetical protein